MYIQFVPVTFCVQLYFYTYSKRLVLSVSVEIAVQICMSLGSDCSANCLEPLPATDSSNQSTFPEHVRNYLLSRSTAGLPLVAALRQPPMLLQRSDRTPSIPNHNLLQKRLAPIADRQLSGRCEIQPCVHLPQQSRHARIVERQSAEYHREQHHTRCPNVGEMRIVRHAAQYLRTCVRIAATVRLRMWHPIVVLARETEIDQLQHVGAVEQQILALDIAMYNAVPMAILDGRHQLPVHMLGKRLLELAARPNPIEQ